MIGICMICGSQKNVRFYQKKQVLCGKHREQMRRFGQIRERTLASGNMFIDVGAYFEMIVYNRHLEQKGKVLIDHKDKEKIQLIGSWCIDKQGYVINGKGKGIKIHQLIMGNKHKKEIDHRNGNKLDNRRENLEHVTHSENVKRGWIRRHLASGKDPESFFKSLNEQES